MSSKIEQAISVIVPENPFIPNGPSGAKHCLAALNVEKLMEWWPGQPHTPHRDAEKVRNIQRSLDWKRVAQIASYLRQEEIVDAAAKLDQYFSPIYKPKKNEAGRQWPPKVPRVVGFTPSNYPTFSNILVHVNGASIKRIDKDKEAATLYFEEDHRKLNFTVIDGQHRINGAYFALMLLREEKPDVKPWEIPAEVFIDLDKIGDRPKHQAQIFIDVNSNQKKVDRSLVADLYPTARGKDEPYGVKARAQDLGRKLMLETGPLVGMIQIPGIRYGVKDVVALATLNGALELAIPYMRGAGLETLSEQVDFLSQCLGAWLESTGRKEVHATEKGLSPENVAYQGRVLVSFLTLTPACIHVLQKSRKQLISGAAHDYLTMWCGKLLDNAGLRKGKMFVEKKLFKEKGFLGAGGLARFRDLLWAAAFSDQSVSTLSIEKIGQRALECRGDVERHLKVA